MHRHDAVAFAAIAIASAACLYGIGPRVGMTEHECYVAQTAREMRASGDWLVPRFSGAPRLRKTPLPYWTVAAAGALTGRPADERTARLPSALSGVGTVLCVWAMARMLFGPRTGAVTAWVAACNAAVLYYAHLAVVDMQLTFWCALCYLIFLVWMQRRERPSGRWWAYAFFLTLGVAMLAKAVMAGIVVAAPIAVFVVYTLATRQWTWRDVRLLRPVEGVLLCALVAAPWWVLVWLKVDGARDVWEVEFLDRFTGDRRGRDAALLGKPWFYLPWLAAFALPWTLSLVHAVSLPFRAERPRRLALMCLWMWLAVPLVIITVASTKREHYLLPAMPAALVLLGPVVEAFFFRNAAAGRTGWRVGGLIGVGAAAIAVFCAVWTVMAPRFDMAPSGAALRRLVAAHVPRGGELRWVGQHPCWVYYAEQPAARLDDPMEYLKSRRRSDRHFDMDAWAAARVDGPLRDVRPVWLLISAEHAKLLGAFYGTPFVQIGAVAPPPETKQATIALITNAPRPRPSPDTPGPESSAGR